jgi:hypothetical protein
LLVPVATTGTNGLYKPGLKDFFPPVACGVSPNSGNSGGGAEVPLPPTVLGAMKATEKEWTKTKDLRYEGFIRAVFDYFHSLRGLLCAWREHYLLDEFAN